MTTFLLVIHIIVSFLLIFIVLIQGGKGAEMGAAFGGGSSQTVFGSRGASTFLGKITTGVAVLFMVTSLLLAMASVKSKSSSVVNQAPATQTAIPADGQGSPVPPSDTGSPVPPAQTSAPAPAETPAKTPANK